MKTVGILTHWSIPNFGAFLQAYALRNVVEGMFPGCDVKQIAYMNKIHSGMYYSLCVPGMFRLWPINPNFYKDVFCRLLHRREIYELRHFIDYYDGMIPHTMHFNEKNIKSAEFDCLILGSDILWDYSIPFFGHDRHVFGHDIKSKSSFSYAASFGMVKRGDTYPDYVVEGIRRLDAISVRDDNSRQIVNDITGKNATVVLDPTFLWDFKNDVNIKEPDIQKYIVVYGNVTNQSDIYDIIQIKEKHKIPVVNLGSKKDKAEWADISICENEITPFEWCGYIKNAELIITSTFHGLVFGLIYEKRIAFIATDFMRSKATSMIESVGLKEILLDEPSIRKQLDYEWNYDVINNRIEDLRIVSIDYIRSSMGIRKHE